MDASDRQHSLELDLYVPCGTPDFSDHVGPTNDIELIDGNLIDNNSIDANYQRFIRIASAQELEELDIFNDTNDDSNPYSMSTAQNDLAKMDPEARAAAEAEWRNELVKVEEEIATLRSVLASKTARMQDLKRKLGITVWKEFKDDMEQGIKNIRESTVYQKTTQTLRTAGEKTSEAIGTLGAAVNRKVEEARKSQTYKSLEEKVETAVTNVKAKVSGENSGNGSTPQNLSEK